MNGSLEMYKSGACSGTLRDRRKMPLYLPVEKTAGVTAYKRYAEGDVYSDAIRGARSPKELFFPQTEDLVKFKTEGKKIEIIDPRTPGEDFAVFGVHGAICRR